MKNRSASALIPQPSSWAEGRVVLVTRKTRLDELILRFNTREQARFYIEHAGGDFADYEREHAAYQASLDIVRRQLDSVIRVQQIDRAFLPTYLFSAGEIVMTLGQDGLVANTAKYARGLPIIGVNPEPSRFDGILLPFAPDRARRAVEATVAQSASISSVTMASATLADGQRLLAFNDLFIGARSHVSARYRIAFAKKEERQSSSGIIVATGSGSTGWLSSIFNMASALASRPIARPAMKREDPKLVFVVREPFLSRATQAGIVSGEVVRSSELLLESLMPDGGVIFSDGVEADFLNFNSGAVAHISVAEERAMLVTSA